MIIKDLYSEKNMPIDFVIGKLNGFYGTFKNTKSIKYYFIIEGNILVVANLITNGNDFEVELKETNFSNYMYAKEKSRRYKSYVFWSIYINS